MLYRFPPLPSEAKDPSFITGTIEIFAKLKIESKASKRTVFMTEHTLIFVTKGVKRLHFAAETLEVSANEVFLLKKGIYVMTEYIEEGLDFEALMLFLPSKILRSFLLRLGYAEKSGTLSDYCLVFPIDSLIQTFREQLRMFFENRHLDFDQIIPLKQKEILLLLLSSQHYEKVARFISNAATTVPEDIEYIVKTYLFQPITTTELASLANRSLAAFKRDFQRLYGIPPRTWINQQRLNHGQLLLKNTNMSVAEVGFACAFENPSHFIRSFKKAYGFTPKSMRANMSTV